MIGENLKDLLDEIKKQRVKVYSIFTFPLDVARDDFEMYVTGTYLYVLLQAGLVSIRFNEMFSDSIDLFKNRSIIVPFYRIYISNTAQAGLSITLAVGVSSDIFSISDYGSPDITLMSSYTQQLRDSYAHAYGTQISKSNVANNATVIVHTVTAGKTLLLENWAVNYITSQAASNVGSLLIRDASDVTQYIISTISIYPQYGSGFDSSQCLVSIPAGYDVCLVAGPYMTINAWIKGREV